MYTLESDLDVTSCKVDLIYVHLVNFGLEWVEYICD